MAGFPSGAQETRFASQFHIFWEACYPAEPVINRWSIATTRIHREQRMDDPK